MLARLYKIFVLVLLISFLPGISLIYGADKKFTVVIDAGHGGKDIGATDNGVMEKNINLKVAKELESLIKKKMKNAKVVMTRDGDNYLTLQERAEIANKSQGDIFISIHTNSVDKKNKNRKNIAGSSVYTLGLHKDESNLEVAMRENSVIELETDYEQKYSGFDPQKDESYIIFEMVQKQNLNQSIRFAESIEKELVKSGRQNRGVHQAGFWVLWATSMPSVLVELDFICNPSSASYMSSDKGAKELANSIFKALQDYENLWERNRKHAGAAKPSYTYQEDQESVLEDTYITINEGTYSKAKKRMHKTPENTSSTLAKNTDIRRRRSSHSRDLSLNNSYEQGNLEYKGERDYSMVSQAEEEPKEIQIAADFSKNKNKGKKKNDKKKDNKKADSGKDSNKETKSKKERKKDAHNAKVNKLVTVYKIQVLASSDLLNQSNTRFCGLSPISTYKENNLYKYFYGESTDKAEIEALLADVKQKIPDAFIVSSQKSIQKHLP